MSVPHRKPPTRRQAHFLQPFPSARHPCHPAPTADHPVPPLPPSPQKPRTSFLCPKTDHARNQHRRHLHSLTRRDETPVTACRASSFGAPAPVSLNDPPREEPKFSNAAVRNVSAKHTHTKRKTQTHMQSGFPNSPSFTLHRSSVRILSAVEKCIPAFQKKLSLAFTITQELCSLVF